MAVITCSEADRTAWDAYVEGNRQASFYHRYSWREVNQEEFGHRSRYLAVSRGGGIVGIFPIVLLRSRLFGRIACSMPFVNFGGPCADSEAVCDELLDAAREYVASERAAYLEMRNRVSVGRSLPTSLRKISMTVDLADDPERLWKAFTTDHRRDIRRAYKNGMLARFGAEDLLDPFYDILSESWHSLGTPLYRKRYFERILQTFRDSCRICVVFADGVPAAAAFNGCHGDTTEGMWLGIRARFRPQMAGYVLYWELIKDACEHRFRRFHLGRSSSDSGSEAFKRKWNAYPTQLHWQYLLGTRRQMPALNVENPKYRFAIDGWRRLPLPVVSRIGPYIARSIP